MPARNQEGGCTACLWPSRQRRLERLQPLVDAISAGFIREARPTFDRRLGLAIGNLPTPARNFHLPKPRTLRENEREAGGRSSSCPPTTRMRDTQPVLAPSQATKARRVATFGWCKWRSTHPRSPPDFCSPPRTWDWRPPLPRHADSVSRDPGLFEKTRSSTGRVDTSRFPNIHPILRAKISYWYKNSPNPAGK